MSRTPRHSELRPHPQAETYDRLVDLYVFRMEPDDEVSDEITTVSVVYFDHAVQDIADEMSADSKRLTPKEVQFLKGCVGAIVRSVHGPRKSKRKTSPPKVDVTYYRNKETLQRDWDHVFAEIDNEGKPDEEE